MTTNEQGDEFVARLYVAPSVREEYLRTKDTTLLAAIIAAQTPSLMKIITDHWDKGEPE